MESEVNFRCRRAEIRDLRLKVYPNRRCGCALRWPYHYTIEIVSSCIRQAEHCVFTQSVNPNCTAG